MIKKVNIIIPSITISEELIRCLKGINSLNYKNFIVTMVIDYDNKKKLPKFNFKLKKLIVGKIFMSKKRNLAAKKFKTEFIAFIDSDCYPCKNWLKNAIKYLSDKRIHVVGGPNIPFKKQSYSEKITSYCKRSFFISGHLNYRKYKSPKRYCEDYLESCNLIMRRNVFLNNNGMNENIYIGEDREFFENLKEKVKNFKAFFSPDIFVYHKQRKILKFLLQRLSYGTVLVESVTFRNGLKGFIPGIPIASFFAFLILISSSLSFVVKTYIFITLFLFVNLLIFYEISKSIKNFKDKAYTLLIINLANVMHVFGGVMTLLGLKKIFDRKTFVLSRSNF
jgi:cellulose synthase/poly-beta-1,6-N-acetylglucosamine synthase-like glycosyltransferase|tara:strand:- start:55 stop:1062 length:1008 start_codon:yes stop_codon:yes gene_type:complete